MPGLYGLIFAASKFGDFTRLTYWRNLIVMVSKLMFFKVIINSDGDCFEKKECAPYIFIAYHRI